MKYFFSITVLGVLLFFPQFLKAQIPTKTILGQVTHVPSGSPLPGINVILKGHELLLGTTTDADGYFRISGFLFTL